MSEPVYFTAAPPPPLDRFIDAFSYWEGAQPSNEQMDVIATAAMSLQINLSAPTLRWYEHGSDGRCHRLQGITLSGVHTGPFGIDAYQPRRVRVIFKPGGAWPFFAPPAGELRNTVVAFGDVWGSAAECLRENLAAATGVPKLFSMLAEHLMAAATRPLGNHPAVAMVLARSAAPAGHDLGIGALAEASGVSRKRLIRLFTEEVGMTPKRYLRLARFERLLTAAGVARPGDWAGLAAQSGYFDQPHLIRDFREFTGMTPSDFLRRRSRWHHALRAER